MAGAVRLSAPLLLLLFASACDVFSTRTPDPPINEGGTYVQPSEPEQVVANMRNAVAELNARNYRRAFGPTFKFDPTATAQAQDPSIWTGWGVQDEESYFRALAAAAAQTIGDLQLIDETLSALDPSTFTYQATYLLTVNHRRGDLAETLNGRLVWTIEQGEDGLWYITEWSDREVDDRTSWSELKAAFIK